MKTLALLLVLAMATAAMPADWTKPKKSDGYKFEITECGENCIQIESENNTIRYYSCGQVKKLVWKEINPNEDTSVEFLYIEDSTGTATALSFDTEEMAIAFCQHGYHQVDDYWVCD
jgi:hypothetical protein